MKSKSTRPTKDEYDEEKGQSGPLRNPPELDGVPDLSQLIHLDMPNVLHNLKYRYCNMPAMPTKFCYTQISSILLAINPYETLPIYGMEVINQFRAAALKGRMINDRPHPYGVSARSYMRMVQRKHNQSVIVCGESGAGKTETTKLLMRYLAMTAPVTMAVRDDVSIEQQIVAASPILEAFGNAKTVMNNNSSRFGKFTKLLYHVADHSQEGHILGSSLETYLLEKSRVVYQAMNERNYHIFYFMHEGLGHHNAEYGLETVDQFHYTNQGKVFDSMKDKERFDELRESLSLFRIDEDVQSVIWKLTAGVLNLGNVEFFKTDDGYAEITKSSMCYVNMVASLWGLKAPQLEKRLTTQSLKVGPGKPIVKKVQFDHAVSNRDSIAKGIYENIFLWLCKRINAELLVEDEDEDESKSKDEGRYFIGILDVFGFENFWSNSLEQFCINYTNEKLQQYFNHHVIASEQEEYEKEGVFWTPLDVPDNEHYINFVEHSKHGFVKLLDGNAGTSANDTEAFMQILFKKHKDNPCIERRGKAGSGSWRGVKPKSATRRNRGRAKFDGFMIKHYADDVTYDVSKFLVKNAESVHSDTAKMIAKSSVPLFKEINGKKKKKKKSVTSVFYSGIKKLMSSLDETEPYFVRCINPNKRRSGESEDWDSSVVEHQLRCGGLIEALRVLSLGYPTRVPYKALHEKYHCSVTNPLIRNMDEVEFSTSLLIAFDVNREDYELGLTKIFFKPAKAEILETIMSQAGQPLTAEQNAKITRYIVGKRMAQIVGTAKVMLAYKKRVRVERAKKEWRRSGRVAAILGGTVMKHLTIAREMIRERKEKQLHLLMERYVLGNMERKRFLEEKRRVQEATTVVLTAYNVMKHRQALSKWVDAAVERRRQIVAAERAQSQVVEVESEAKPEVEPEVVPQVEPRSESGIQSRSTSEVEEVREAEPTSKVAAAEREHHATSTMIINPADTASESAEREQKEQFAEENDLTLERRVAEAHRKQDRASITSTTSSRGEDDRKQQREEYQKQAAKGAAARKEEEDKLRLENERPNDDSGDEDEWKSEDEPDCDECGHDYDLCECTTQKVTASALRSFRKTAAMGQLFHRHTAGRRRRRPQDRVIKVSFDAEGNPHDISWGKGSRHIAWRDIMYIAWGHWTPCFVKRKAKLNGKKCLSIVATDGTVLDLEGYNRAITELWVRGLRKLMGHSDEQSDALAKKNMKNLMDGPNHHPSRPRPRPYRPSQPNVAAMVRLQEDLYIMTTHTVLRNLEEERIWRIDQEVRDKFMPQKTYPTVLQQDIPWRHWQQLLREQVTSFCRQTGKLNIAPPVPPPPVVHTPYVPPARPMNPRQEYQPLAKPKDDENCVIN